MANEKVKVLIHGQVKTIPKSALRMAEEFFGAQIIGDKVQLPLELTKPLLIPKKEIGKPIDIVMPPEVVKIEPVIVAPILQPAPKQVKKTVKRKPTKAKK